MPILRFLGNVIKKKVAVPQFNQISADTEEANTIADNLRQLPAASEYTRALNKENQSQMDQQFAHLIPGFSDMTGRISQNIQNQLEGKLPADVIDQINRSTVAKSVEGGYAGSQFGKNLTARDLGLNSLQLAQQGLTNAQQWIANTRMNRTAPLVSPSSMFLSPEQRTQLDVGERDKKLQRDYLSNQMKAAQNWRTYLGQALGELDSYAMSALSAYAGGMTGGMMSFSGGKGGNSGSGSGPDTTGPGGWNAPGSEAGWGGYGG